MIRLAVVDDQYLVRDGLASILGRQDGFEVVATAADGVEAVELVRRTRPDVTLMDVRMPRMDGVEATRQLMADDPPPTRVLMLTTFDEDELVASAIRAGASGFLLKDAPRPQILDAIRAVHEGDLRLAPSITRRLVDRHLRRTPVSPSDDLLTTLTERETDVLRRVARGMSNAEIAGDLYLSESTVKTHVGRLLQKLRLRDRVQLVILAYETGLVDQDSD